MNDVASCARLVLAAAFAQAHPNNDVIAADASPSMIAAAAAALPLRPNLRLKLADASVPVARGCKGNVFCSVLHEVYSYATGGQPIDSMGRVEEALRVSNRSLASGGLSIVRDFIQPQNGDTAIVLRQLKSDITGNDGVAGSRMDELNHHPASGPGGVWRVWRAPQTAKAGGGL